MSVRKLNIGDVFRVAGDPTLWRKASGTQAVPVGQPYYDRVAFARFAGRAIEVVERAEPAEIRRSENVLILRGGEVTLQYIGAWRIHRCTPGDPFTEFVLARTSLGASEAPAPTADTALAFAVGAGARHLGRAQGSEVFAYRGRVYARVTKADVGAAGAGAYKLMRKVDGARRLVIKGLLTLPGESALYDIIMEHFGPDTAPRPAAPAE